MAAQRQPPEFHPAASPMVFTHMPIRQLRIFAPHVGPDTVRIIGDLFTERRFGDSPWNILRQC